ncbi:MAG: ABC transporter permease [Paracoccaceae bacterium]|nr:MAG: ABC transporter permease [Paracoccaceae bacterium]
MTMAGTRRITRTGRRIPPVDGRRLGRWTLLAAAALAFLFIQLPLFFVTWLSFYGQEIPSYPPSGYSLEWYRAILSNERFIDGLLLSLQLGVIATALGLILAVPAALALSHFRFPGRATISNLLLMPLMVPGVVLGTAIYVFHVETEINTGLPIIGSLGGLVWGHVLVTLPWITRLVTASLAQFDRTLEEAAQSLGATPWTTFRRVTLPAILPGVVAGAMFAFVASFGNLEMTLFLVGPGRTTLPIAILQYLQWKIDPTIAAISVVQIALVFVAMIVTDRFVRLSRVV